MSGAEGGAEPASSEKAAHQRYLRDFRVDQCPYFPNYKCEHHKPYTCFYWHFPNQRRRRPTLTPDATFNYSPDAYCVKYDEILGICPSHDECPFLHRTLGDTERRYHPRYYKTVMCVHDVGTLGHCAKNGPHCAFAHGLRDLRNPVYGIVECRILRLGLWLPPEGWVSFLHEDPSWKNLHFVLANYKTSPCLRPPQLGLCRLGLACPNFHDRRDRRRSPASHSYSSTPCPSVRQGTEWSDTDKCPDGDKCTFCHSRTEQKFHPDIYKSTMCNDLQRTSYCPRGPFCSFAHSEKEVPQARDAHTKFLSPVVDSPDSEPTAESKSGDVVSEGENLGTALLPFVFDPAPGAGRRPQENIALSHLEAQTLSANSEVVPNAATIDDDERLVDLVSSVVTSVLSSADSFIEAEKNADRRRSCTDSCHRSIWLAQPCAADSSCSVWDPSGIWADQQQHIPKSCLMCAVWKRKARACARRVQLAEEEKQEALAKLGELEKRLDDATRPKPIQR